jgi:hypothetical protein
MITRKTQLTRLARDAGLDPARLRRSLRGIRPYIANRRELYAQAQRSAGEFPLTSAYPCLTDRFAAGGVAKGQYFHQDLHVAQQIFAAAPERHADVGSRVDGFVAHVAAFRPIDVFDIRPIRSGARNVAFIQRDITEPDARYDGYCDSLSCLHALEHFGLGRYGDRVDYYGYRKGWDNLCRMLRPGGTFYFSVPISRRQRIEFDAHRVFSVPYVVDDLAAGVFDVGAFAYVDDRGRLHRDVDVADKAARKSFGLTYGCGIFTLVRR